MKSLVLFATIVAVSVLLFAVTPINACEKPCRVGISKAFGDNYDIETKKLLKTFVKNLQTNAYNGLKVKSSTKTECNKVIANEITKFQKKFASNMPDLIENSIFEQSPQFKGQCQNPLRVKQPPAGVAWTMEDCEKQDYICGNPPAICHFMDQHVKPRNVKNVKGSMTSRLATNGSFFKTLVKALTDTAKKTGVKGKDLESFSKVVPSNISKEFKRFATFYASEFCKGTTCNKYDNGIKVKLLSYP